MYRTLYVLSNGLPAYTINLQPSTAASFPEKPSQTSVPYAHVPVPSVPPYNLVPAATTTSSLFSPLPLRTLSVRFDAGTFHSNSVPSLPGLRAIPSPALPQLRIPEPGYSAAYCTPQLNFMPYL
ncbi:hypothetical protein GYMLUDRAFT_247207 [Collybiopsis luxurians FD-317 M1]|uniref:Uncharacterized protein n=1 Tax=Collybiopsis luxurians FD-317 M1 TaxID=944289 RepID=A0A0D0C484_9AGAR|nr:hypothetical protein GYMLUDRAFT_247207 [Collybiopsis luxurians FD-317 M1]